MWNELNRYRRLSAARRQLLWEALAAFTLARFAMAFLSFKRIAVWLGTPGRESPLNATAEQVEVAAEIGWAVGCLARRVPWDSRCLAQGLAATWMLRRRGLESTLSFGADRGSSREFIAHAWLRFGPSLVTGGGGRERFKTLTSITRKLT
ncbi:MAG TPA: lasso peptide biosynthesis B2 protein [Terriglobales bacterium]|nr:lasso peptide biosynthesis B2 protein [Terriglobales bacterium]